MDLEPFIAAGIYDPESPKAAERREFLEHLLERFDAHDIIESARTGPLHSISVSLSGSMPTKLSARAVAEACGADLNDFVQLRVALGFPVADVDDPSVPDSAIEDFQLFLFAESLFGAEKVLAFARVLGSTTRRLTEAARAVFSSSLTGDQTTSVTELEMSQANETSMAIWEVLPNIVGHLMWERTAREEEFTVALMAGEVQMAVAFVDLVGSTSWALEVAPLDHSRALSRFEAAAWDMATRHGGRVVKLIGDEAMIVAEEPEVVCRIALDLCAFVAADGVLPAATGAVGVGRVTARDGDYFGPIVNLVARATKSAPKDGIVVTDQVVATLDPNAWTIGSPEAVELRGIDKPVLLHVLHARANG